MAGAGQAGASSSYASTSTARSSTYDVFLNFRGEDTRKGFTGHLYNALNRELINVFMDSHKLREGEEIGPKLMEAIQGSKISIPIFSKGYADSKWCLMELEKILECHTSNDQIVLPIFLDVEPSDVRHQSGESFEKAFLEHNRNFQPERVKRWREALSEIGKMKGWVLDQIDNGDESTLIQRVVKRILEETRSNYLSDVKHPVGLDSRVNDIGSLLNIGSKDVRFVGIWGEGGIGKTTIAKAVYNNFIKSFDHNCFLENTREEAETKGLVSLQEKLIYGITKRKVAGEISLVDGGKEEIRKRCQGVNVLLVLDDVDHRSQLDALAIDLKWLGQGSRVIITTRDEHVLNVANVDPSNMYRPKELDPDQSLRLFSLHAFKLDEPFEDYKELSRDVARYSGGLPLTLEVLGSYLLDVRDKEGWESALEKLRASPHEEVYKKLKISYDKLEDVEQKAIFLDAACFFIGSSKERVISVWEACGYHPKLAIEKLVQRSLLKFSPKKRSLLKFSATENSVVYLEMHDQIRDMGRQIDLDESGMPGKRSRLWARKDIVEVLEGQEETASIEGILLKRYWQEPRPEVYLYTESLEKMSSLRFLDVQGVHFKGDDFPHLPPGLRWFRWWGCPIKERPVDFYHRRLIHLDLSWSNIQKAWTTGPQNERNKFQNLKVLDLSRDRDLYKCPDFSWFPSLERLDLSFCPSLADVDESIGQLRNLKYLDLYECSSLIKLPDGVGLLEKLEVLDVQFCRSLAKLPRSMRRMRCLHSIRLYGTRISNLPNDFLMLSSLVELDMCRGTVQELFKTQALRPHTTGGPLPICGTRAYVSETHGHTGSPGGRRPQFPMCFSTAFSQLRTLSLVDCYSVESLPADLSALNNLQELNLGGLEKLGDLPELPSSLITLFCLDCKSLARLPDLSRLKNLRTFFLQNCYKLEKIEGIEGMESLERLRVEGCYKVTQTPRKQCFKVRRLEYEPRLNSRRWNPHRWDEDEEEDSKVKDEEEDEPSLNPRWDEDEEEDSEDEDEEEDSEDENEEEDEPSLNPGWYEDEEEHSKDEDEEEDEPSLNPCRDEDEEEDSKDEDEEEDEPSLNPGRDEDEEEDEPSLNPGRDEDEEEDSEDEDEEEDEPLFLGPRCLGVLRRFTNSSQMRKAAGSDHLCLLESEGVRRDYSFSNANANDDEIPKRLSLIIVFAFKSHCLRKGGFAMKSDCLQEGELICIELGIGTSIFGKDGKETKCFHTILIENVEFTRERDIIYIHDLEGFTWFGFPLEGKDAMSELSVEVDLYKLSDSGVDHLLQSLWRNFNPNSVELKFWSLEYVNEECGQGLPNKEDWVDRIVRDILSGPWPHLHAAAALIEQDKIRSDYDFEKYISEDYSLSNLRDPDKWCPWSQNSGPQYSLVSQGRTEA